VAIPRPTDSDLKNVSSCRSQPVLPSALDNDFFDANTLGNFWNDKWIFVPIFIMSLENAFGKTTFGKNV